MSARAPSARVLLGQDAGIARIVAEGGQHVGMAILVDSRTLVTCAHVVNRAIPPLPGQPPRQADDTTEPPMGTRLQVVFPLLATHEPLMATVDRWRPPGSRAQDDMAILRLTVDAPAEVGFAVLADVVSPDLSDDQLSVYGMAGTATIGNHVDARFMGTATGAWAQIDGTTNAGIFIQGGYSGSAVWDKRHCAVVGMVVAKRRDPLVRVAYMLPASALKRFEPALPIEVRSLPAWINAAWFVLAGAVFSITLALVLVERGAFGGDAIKQLAELWGASLYSVLAWLPALVFYRYAQTMHLHPWWLRLPSMRPGSALRSPTSARIVGAVAIIMLVLLPMCGQGHFLNQLHDDEGRVAITVGQFGYDDGADVLNSDQCTSGKGLCTLRGLGLYNLAPAGPGGRWGYFDNAYRYGDRHMIKTHSFYPILQPALIWAGTAISLLLSVLAFWRVFRPAGR